MDETTQPGHERSDFNPAAVVLFGAALAATILVTVAACFIILKYAGARYAARQAPAASMARTREAAPAPRLQVKGFNELRAMREAEEGALNSYAWIDVNAGIVRIPVERAMEIIAAKEKGKSDRQIK